MSKGLEIHFLKTSQNHVANFKTNFEGESEEEEEEEEEDDDDDGDEEGVKEAEGGRRRRRRVAFGGGEEDEEEEESGTGPDRTDPVSRDRHFQYAADRCRCRHR